MMFNNAPSSSLGHRHTVKLFNLLRSLGVDAWELYFQTLEERR